LQQWWLSFLFGILWMKICWFQIVNWYFSLTGKLVTVVCELPICDRSGSMAGSKMTQTRSTMEMFLRSLPEGVLFNIGKTCKHWISQVTTISVGFGSRFEYLFPSSVPYNQENLQIASEHVKILE
jgi:hypothetical protein